MPKILPKIDMPLACLLVCDTQIYEWTDKLTMDQQDAQAKNKKKTSSKRSRKSSSVRHKQANRRCCAIILLRWKDHMIIRYSNSRLIYIYICILIHNTKYAPSHCHINIPVQYSMYDTYSLYSNYEYNDSNVLSIHLVLHQCTDWILLDPVHANVASFLRTRINVVKGRIAWYVAALHHIQSRITSFTKDPKRRRVLLNLAFENISRCSSHDIRAATCKPLLRPPSQCPRPGKEWCTT